MAEARPNLGRFLGAAFLVVVLTSLSGGVVLSSAVGPSSAISDILASIASRPALLRIAILVDLATTVGVVVMAALLYTILSMVKRPVALLAYSLWLGEAFALGFSKVAAAALIPLSQDFVQAGMPAHSYYQTLGQFLYSGVVTQLGQTTHMFFYCTGGLLWYWLFYRSRYVPRWLSGYGIAAVAVALLGVLAQFLGFSVPIFVFLPILPFELGIGFWLLIKGIGIHDATLRGEEMAARAVAAAS